MASLLANALPKLSQENPIQQEAIRYGELVESVYDGNNEGKERSRFYCYPLFGKSELFSKLQLEGRGYKITRYIYATEGSGNKTSAKWFGYVAVSDEEQTKRLGRRDVVVTFRGTMGSMLTGAEWWDDYNCVLLPFSEIVDGGLKPCVHRGFYNLYTASYKCHPSEFGGISARDQIIKELQTLLSTYGDQQVRINVTGHSLGGALATLAACDVAHNIAKDRAGTEVYAYTFGSPRVGNEDFRTATDGHARVMRFTNKADIVPTMPPSWRWLRWLVEYVHVGTRYMVHYSGSPFIATIDFSVFHPSTYSAAWPKCHNLELSLHAIAAGQFSAPGAEPYVASFVSLQRSTKVLEETGNAAVVEATEDILEHDEAAVQEYLREVQEVVQEQQQVAQGLHPRGKRDWMTMMMMAKPNVPSQWDTRDYALVNKSADLLRDEYKEMIPPFWWNMLVNQDLKMYEGKWVPRCEDPKDNPTPENPDYN